MNIVLKNKINKNGDLCICIIDHMYPQNDDEIQLRKYTNCRSYKQLRKSYKQSKNVQTDNCDDDDDDDDDGNDHVDDDDAGGGWRRRLPRKFSFSDMRRAKLWPLNCFPFFTLKNTFGKFKIEHEL